MRALQWRSIRGQHLEISYQISCRYAARKQDGRWKCSATRQVHTQSPVNFTPFFKPDLPVLRQSDVKVKASILEDAAAYGIKDLETLAIEADVGHKEHLGKRLVDQVANRQDLDLWVILLDYRFFVDGEQGVEDILYGMRYRGKAVNLFSDDVASEYVWNALLPIAVRNRAVLAGLCSPSTGLGRKRQTLFMDMVGLLIQKCQIEVAADTAAWLRSYYRGKTDVLELFRLACENTSLTIEDFCTVHERLPHTPIYGDVVPKLMSEGRVEEAWLLHAHLLQKGDLPTSFEQIDLLVRDLVIDGKDLDPFVHSLERLDVSFSAQIRRAYEEEMVAFSRLSEPVNKALLYKNAGRRPRKLTDEFVARAFATKAVSFNFVLNALQPFGLVEVGPLSVRQMALSTSGIEELQERFLKLQELQIDFGSSAYVAVVKRLCMSNSKQLLQSILESDQHYEVFEDHATQKRLLANYFKTSQWMEVNKTLAILNRGRTTIKTQRLSSQFLLQAAIMTQDWRGALQIIGDMFRHKHGNDIRVQRDVTDISLKTLVKLILPRTRDLKTAVQLDRSEYAVGLLQDVVCSGIHVSAQYWRQLLFSLGDLRSVDQLERLCLWLAVYYQRKQPGSSASASINQFSEVRLNDIFSLDVQVSIVEASLCAASFAAPNLSRDNLQSRAKSGIQLLWQLREQFEISIEYEAVRTAFMSRLQRIVAEQILVDKIIALFDILWDEDISRLQHEGQMVQYSASHMLKLLKDVQYRSRINPYSINVRDADLVPFFEKQDVLSDNADTDLASQKAAEDLDIDYVEYRDLFHPSSKDYTKNEIK